jgi:transposase-like protein
MDATVSANGSTSSEVTEKAQRRRFGGEYKGRIVEQYDALSRGERGALLRREGLYSSHIDAWRKQREAGVLSGLATKRRGPKAKERRADDSEKAALRRQVARLERKLKQAQTIIEIQKKVARALDDLETAQDGEKD